MWLIAIRLDGSNRGFALSCDRTMPEDSTSLADGCIAAFDYIRATNATRMPGGGGASILSWAPNTRTPCAAAERGVQVHGTAMSHCDVNKHLLAFEKCFSGRMACCNCGKSQKFVALSRTNKDSPMRHANRQP